MKILISQLLLSFFITEAFAVDIDGGYEEIFGKTPSRSTYNIPFKKPDDGAVDKLLKTRCPNLDVASFTEDNARTNNTQLTLSSPTRLDLSKSYDFARTPEVNGSSRGVSDSYYKVCQDSSRVTAPTVCADKKHHRAIVEQTGIAFVKCYFGRKQEGDFDGKNHDPLGNNNETSPRKTFVAFPNGAYDLTYSGFRKTNLGDGSGFNETYEMTFDVNKVPNVTVQAHVPSPRSVTAVKKAAEFAVNKPPQYFPGVGENVAPLDGTVVNVKCLLTTTSGPHANSAGTSYKAPSFKDLYAAVLTVSDNLFSCPKSRAASESDQTEPNPATTAP